GVTADLGDCPDGAMAIAVCAAFADGPSHLTGLSSWALKETDRLTAVATELIKLGATVERSDNSLTIQPPDVLRPADISTYDDHRMAMAFSLAGLQVPGVRILDPGVVSKTWPAYWEEMERWT
ncbi:MAG: 3-phosphoshikimate 1-carboxyvinyltransferase, partial [Acidimicrobiia bacterium]|nr:3-phosphoshikimate 1-carboxyvinyltransferase [Acidimicrobiia bacterium]